MIQKEKIWQQETIIQSINGIKLIQPMKTPHYVIGPIGTMN